MWLRVLVVALVGAFAVGLGAFMLLPRWAQDRLNPAILRSPYPLTPEAVALHDRLLVADLHADALLWRRDLNRRNKVGHVDVPRLLEGNVAIQAFTIVTKSPRGQNIERNQATSDMITLLAVLQRWPVKTWGDLTERAVFQAENLRRFSERSAGRLTLLETRTDLRAYLARRLETPEITAGFLGIEGAHALEGDLANLGRLYEAGVRMVGLTHFFDNEAGGSAHGLTGAGLTRFGHQLIQRAEELGMIIDLAHASEAMIDDVLSITRQPVLVSHTGVRGTCDNQRNLSDRHLKAIANTGGIIGIGFWATAVCGSDVRAVVRAIRYAVDQVGPDHVALGSDFDGKVEAPFDAAGMALITQELVAEGFSETEVAQIMGGNVIRILERMLPG